MSSREETFHRLHEGPAVLLLANCWDAGSARLLEHLGSKALATTSAGVAWALGYPDSETVPMHALVPAIEAMVRVIEVPLSVDLNNGYSDDPATVGENVAAVCGAGAVGINIEDGAASAELTARKIEAARKAAERAGVRLFINARTDVYLRGLVPEEQRVAETLRRAALFGDAGASGLFVPKVVAEGEIADIASGTALPLNVLAWPEVPPARRLVELGVKRLSAGSGVCLAALGRTKAVATAFLREGRSEVLQPDAMPYGEMNGLFSD